MEDKKETKIQRIPEDPFLQWAKKQMVSLGSAEEYGHDLSELTGSRYRGDFEKISRMDNYRQAKLLEMMFQRTERRMNIHDLLGVEEVDGLLFAGPSGCGKMTTAEHLVGNLKTMGYTRFIKLTGAMLGNHSGKKALKRMRAALSLASGEQPLILILEQLSENPFAAELYDMILEFAEDQEEESFFPVFIEQDAEVFSPALQRDFPLLSFSLPSLEERKNYISLHRDVEVVLGAENAEEPDGENEIFSYKIVFDGITLEEIAKETEGFSYAQLKQLMKYIRLQLANIVIQDPVSEQKAYESLQIEGYYKVRGHQVRLGIAMLNTGKKSTGHGLRLLEAQIPGVMQDQRQMRGQAQIQTERSSLSAEEEAVQAAADGGKKNIPVLIARYKNQVHQVEAFGEVDERLAKGAEVYDKEEE